MPLDPGKGKKMRRITNDEGGITLTPACRQAGFPLPEGEGI